MSSSNQNSKKYKGTCLFFKKVSDRSSSWWRTTNNEPSSFENIVSQGFFRSSIQDHVLLYNMMFKNIFYLKIY